MIVQKLSFERFRNLEDGTICPGNEINVIYGDNAQGKTNLLEALSLFSGQKSFRGARDADLIRRGETGAKLEISFWEDQRDQTASVTLDNGRTATLNGVPLERATELGEHCRAVIFSPDDLSMISDGPAERRKFMDTVIGGLYPRYTEKQHRYFRAVDQRNAVLKDYRTHAELALLLDDFEAEIVKLGTELLIYRYRFVQKLNEICPDIYRGFSGGKEEFSATYLSTAGETSESFADALVRSREEDCMTLATSVGPHRDELEILLDGFSARKFGSQGQKRSAAITLKLAESFIVEQVTGQVPVVLLDDVMSELDRSRQTYILNRIQNRQVFITCCEPGNLEGLAAGKVFRVTGGKVEESCICM